MQTLSKEAELLVQDAKEIVKEICSPRAKGLVAKLARSCATLYVNIIKEEEK